MNKQIIRCENCIHNEVCYLQEVCDNIEEQLDEFGCEDFADKSLYIKLPCKVGDVVYTVSKRDGIVAKMVVEISWKRDWAGKDLGWGLILSGKRSNNRYNVSGIGKTVFLTKEEAEKALKGGAGDG